MISVADCVGCVTVMHGSARGVFPVAGARVGNLRRSLVHALNVPESALAFVNGVEVEPAHRLGPDDTLEFCVRAGRKGGKSPKHESFDTTARVAEILERLKTGIARDSALMADRLDLALEHGQLAIELKKLLSHGEFGTYLKDTFPKSYQTVNRWMKLAGRRDEVQRIRSSDPDKVWSVQGMLDHLGPKTASTSAPSPNVPEVASQQSSEVPEGKTAGEVVQAVRTSEERPEPPKRLAPKATKVNRAPRLAPKATKVNRAPKTSQRKTVSKPKKVEHQAVGGAPKPISRFEAFGSLRVNIEAPEGTTAEELKEILGKEPWSFEVKSRPEIGISMEYVVIEEVTTPDA